MRALFLVLPLALAPLTPLACSSDDPGGAGTTPTSTTTSTAPVPTVLPDGAPNPDATLPDGGTPDPDSAVPPTDGGNPSTPGVVGMNGIADWDALGEKAKVNTFRSFFLHQSVGGDLEDGAQFNGYKFEYATSGSTNLKQGLNGGLFSTSNGNPAGKIAEFRSMALANQANLRVAIMKFGYADIVDGKAAGAQTAYQSAVAAVKAAGVRVLHVTPPFVYNVPVENAPKQAMRSWMIATFPSDIIFDLQDIESTEPGSGTRCERGGSWEICNSIRSTSGCPSLNQGVDSASGQGHLCYTHAKRISKAFLYAIYLAGK